MSDSQDDKVVPIRRLRTINRLLSCVKADYQRDEQFQTFPLASNELADKKVIRLGQDISKEIRRTRRQQR